MNDPATHPMQTDRCRPGGRCPQSVAVGRLRTFLSFQRSSLRALFRRRVIASPEGLEAAASEAADRARAAGISHPSQLCRCFVGPANPANPVTDVLADHEPGCKWIAAMCESCAGTGWCIGCGGDGTAPDWDPDKTAPQRPSARRIA